MALPRGYGARRHRAAPAGLRAAARIRRRLALSRRSVHGSWHRRSSSRWTWRKRSPSALMGRNPAFFFERLSRTVRFVRACSVRCNGRA